LVALLRLKLGANNAVLAAVGYHFSLLLNWLRLLCCSQPQHATPPAAIGRTPQLS